MSEKKDWFEEWFESPLYEKLYAHRDEAEAKRLVQLLNKILQLNNCKKLLDLACGRGRHSLNLAEKGYEVTGIDLSKQAIKRAKKKAEKRNLENVQFFVHDMRESLNEKFDAVVNLFTGFGYFSSDEENEGVIENVARMLKKNGIFVIDFLNASKVQKNLKTSESGSFQDIEYDIKRYIKNGAVYKEITFKKEGREKKYFERVKLYDADWFKRKLEKRNFSIERIYGNYEGNEFNAEKSSRLLIICRLNENS